MNQQQVWNKIAPEWHEFKEPGEMTVSFVKKQKGKFLDLGSGSGRYLVKKRGLKFYLVDFSDEMIKLAKKKAKKMKIDAEFFVTETTKLPFDNNYFDSALCDSVLHCIEKAEDRKKTLKELYRVLKPGSRAKLNVWNKDSKRFKNSPKQRFVGWRDKGNRFYYLYTPDEFYNEVEKAGFKIISKGETRVAIPIIVEK